MKSWTYFRLILLSFILASCSRNPLGEDLSQPILNLGFLLTQTCTNNLNQDDAYSCTIVPDEVIANTVWSLSPDTNCAWAAIDPVTGVVAGVPNDNQVGTCQVVVLAKAPKRQALPLVYNVQIQNVAPTLTIANANPILEDAVLAIIRTDAEVQASEEGFGKYRLDNANATAPSCSNNATTLTVDANTGAVSYAPALNYFGTCNINVVFDDENAVANSTASSEFSITVTPVNDAPTIAPVANQSTIESTPISVALNIVDVDSVITCSALHVSATSSVTTLVPPAGIVFSGAIPNCILTLSPIAYASGTTLITVTATDGSLTSTSTFNLDVVAIPDPPVLLPIANQLGVEDTPLLFNINITDPDTVLACNSTFLSATSSNGSLIAPTAITYSGLPPNCTVTMTPALNQFGTSNIIISLTDGPNTVAQAFTATFSPVNDAPVIAAIANKVTNEDVPLTFNFTITDVDSPLSCVTSVSATSSNIALLPIGGIGFGGTAPNCTVTLTMLPDANGITNLAFTVSDGTLSDVANFTLSVNAVNDSPVLSTIGNQSTLEDIPITINFTLTDIDSAVTCAASMTATSSNVVALPVAGITFSGTAPNCTATLTPVPDQNGTSSVSFIANDGALTATQTFTLTVIGVDDPPVLSAIANQSTNEDTPLVVNFTITDPDTTLLCSSSLSATSSNATLLPIGSIVFGGTAPNCTATLSPVLNENGNTALVFSLADAMTTVTQSFTLTVNAVNDAPVLSTILTQTTPEATPLVINFTLNDVDSVVSCTADITLSSSNTALLPLAGMTLGGTAPNCTLTLNPLALQNGTTNISVTATDGALTAVENFVLNVTAVNDPPVISAITNQSMLEDGSLIVNFNISDPDDTLVCGTSVTAASSNVTLQPVSGIVFSGTAPNCTATLTPALNQSGLSNLVFTVSDGTNTATSSFNLTVTAVNDAPVLSVITNQTTSEDLPLAVNFTMTDVDDSLACNTSVTATSSNLTLLPLSGIVFSGTAPNCTATLTSLPDTNGVSNLSFTLTDGTLTDVKNFTFTVNAVNDVPVLSSIANQTTPEDTPLVVNFTINDIDSVLLCSSLNLSATSSNLTLLPVANIVFGGTAPNCTATLTSVAELSGVSNLSITLADNGTPNLQDVKSFSFTVTGVNDAPILSTITNQTINEDANLTINFTISDVDNVLDCATSMSATSSNTSLLPVASIVFSGTAPNCSALITPLANQNGISNLSFTVTDGTLTDAENFTFTVNAVNDAPVMSTITNQATPQDVPIVVNFTINDIDNILACNTSVTATSSNLTLLPLSGIVFGGTAPNCTATLSPAYLESGSSTLAFTVTDGALTDTKSFVFTASAVNYAPTISLISNQTTTEDTPLNVNFTITDADDTLVCGTSVTAASSNLILLPLSGIVFSGTAPNCTATLTPALNQNGLSNLVFTVSDGTNTVTSSFSLTVTAVNDAPVLSAITNQTTSEDLPLAVNFTMTDVDDSLACNTSVTATSSNLTLLPLSGIVFSGTAPNCTATLTSLPDTNGVSNLSFTLTDGTLTDVKNFTFTVNAVNDAPVLSSIANQTTPEDTPLVVNFTINDIDSVLLCSSLNLSATSSNLTLLPVANIVFGGTAPNCTATLTSVAELSGVSNLSITLADNGTPNLQDVKSFSFTVTGVNDAPILSAITNQTINEDANLTINFTISDVDDVLDCATSMSATSSNVSLLPVASIVFSGTAPNCSALIIPLANQNGISNLSFTVTDGTLTDAENFTFTVNAVNDAPVMSTITNQATPQDVPIVVNFTINDIDNILACNTSVTATSSNLTLLPLAGIVFGGTAPNCTATLSPAYLQSGSSTLAFTVTDGSLTDTKSFVFTASAVNYAPTISVISNQTTTEDTPLNVNFTITDADDTLVCGTSVTAASSNLILLPLSGIVFSGTAPNCTATLTPALNQNGLSNLVFTVSDGTNTVTSSFSLTVTAVNDAPVLSAITNQTTSEDLPLAVNFTMTDVDDSLACNTSVTATSSNLTLLPLSGIVFSGTAPNCTATLTSLPDTNGVSNLSFTLTDGTLTDVKNFTFTVNAVNDAPVLSSIANQTTPEDTPLVVNFTITDVDDTLVCSSSVSATSSNAALISPTEIVFSGTAPNCIATLSPLLNANGSSNLSFVVTDGSLSATQSFTFTVTPVNDAPVMAAIANQTTTEDTPLVVNFTITDIDSTLSCATSVQASSSNTGLLPLAGIAFGGTAPNCTVTLSPSVDAIGISSLTFTVTDGGALTDAKSFSFTVTNVNDAPVIATVANQTTAEDTPLAVSFTITDVDSILDCSTSMSATSSNTALLALSGISFGGTAPNCTATLTPVADAFGVSSLSFTVTDGALTDTKSFTFTVTNVNDAPVMTPIANQTTPEDTPLVVNFTITDIDSTLSCSTSVSATSSNIGLQALAGIVFAGTAPNCTATLTPVLNQNGISNLTFTVTDGALSDTQSFSFTVSAVNDAPVLAAISNVTNSEDTPLAVNFTITDVDSALNCSTSMTATSSNVALLPSAAITLSGTAPNCTATLTPLPNQNGLTSITLTVDDGFLTDVKNFTFTVTAVNDAPILSTISNQTTNEDTPIVVNFTVSDIDSILLCTSLNLAVTSSNTTLLPVANVVFGGTAPNCTATMTPALNENGVTNLALTLMDNGTPNLQVVENFSLTVTAVNDAPVMPVIADQVTLEDTPVVVNFIISDVDNVLTCTGAMTANTSNAALIAVAGISFGGTAPNCTATLTPVLNQSGAVNLTFRVSDGTLFQDRTFQVTVTAVDDAPVISAITDRTILEDGTESVNFTITDVDSVLSCSTSMSASSSNTSLLSVAGIVFSGIAPNCNAVLTPLANQSGLTNLIFSVTDGTTASTSPFSLTVTSVNDAPVLSAIGNLTTAEDTALVVAFTITDSDNVLSCATSMAATSSNTALLPVANIVFAGTAPNCTATLTPVADAFGVSNLSFTVSDGSLTDFENFTFTVTAVDDPPIKSTIGDQMTDEDTPLIVNFTMSDVDSTLACNTSMSATSSVTALVPVANIVFAGTAPNCTATISPFLNANGIVSLTFNLTDGTTVVTETFDLTVNAVNDTPVMPAIAAQTTPEDTPKVLNFTITDVDSPITCTGSMNATSSNVTLLPTANIVFGGTVPNCTATFTPALDRFGSTNISFFVSDGLAVAFRTFNLAVTSVNDAPVISAITPQTTLQSTPISINFTISDVDSVLACTSTNLSMTSSNVVVIPTANVVWSGTAPNCTATLTPAGTNYGTSTIDFVVTDGLLTTTSSFVQTVTHVNLAPTIGSIADQTIYEGRSNTISFTIDDPDGPLSCSAANLSATSSNATLMPAGNVVFSGSYPNCTAVMSLAAGQSGTANISITVTDTFLSASTSFVVTGHKIASVALTPLTPIVPKNSNFSFTLMATYSNSQTRNVTTSATWTSSNAAISSFPSPGVMNNTYAGTGVATSTITGTYGAFSANTVATINPATITSLIVNPTTANINVGGGIQIDCIGITSDGGAINLTQSCSWASANALIVSVNNTIDKGQVTGVSLGSATNITATYASFNASAAVTVDTNPPAASDNGTGLTARYYVGTNFNTFANTRIDATVNFSWGAGNNPAGSADSFTARWTGSVKAPTSGTYTFYTQSDDGVRLWVDGVQIINNWTAHGSTENSGTAVLTAGTKHSITLEFYEATGSAQIELRYAGPSVSKQIIPQINLYP